MGIFAYIRVSTDEQARNGDSLDTQRTQVTGYAMMKGWAVDEVFVEAGVSGSVPLAERQQGAILLAAVKPGDIIITPKLDRMFRSAADALATLEELKAQGVALHMIDLGGDVCGNGISKLVFTILSAVAENERDRLRERIREVKANLRAKGVYAGGKRPFGWDVVDSQLIRNEAEQEVIARVLTLKAEGGSIRSISAATGVPAMTVSRLINRAAEAAA